MRQPRHSSYYESILQLRNPYGDVDDVLHFVAEAVKARNQPDISIAKRKKVTNGVDVYLSSNSFAVEVGRELFRAFGGEFVVSKKLFSQSRQTSRVLYRVTVLFRMAPFKVGEYLLLDEKAFKVLSIAKKVLLENVENHKLLEENYKAVLRNCEKLAPVRVFVSKVRPQLEIIHPKTFQSVPVLPVDRASRLVPGEKVRVIFSESGKVWLAS